MRLARFQLGDVVRLGAVVDEGIRPLTDVPPDVGGLLAAGLLDRAREQAAADGPTLPLDDVRLLAPIARPPKLLAAGLNYADHLAETGMPRPEFPVFFNKQSTCVIGPFDDIHKPRVSDMVDYEGELGVVIATRCRHVPIERALDVVAGYLVVNDVTVRDWQLKAPTMTIGKSFDTHGPIGPWVTTTDDIPDPHALQIRTWVNGELVQDGSTKEMLFGVAAQIATLTTAFTLEPGDVIATGTPAGVGMVRKPPLWLKAGDMVRVEIDGLGALENNVIDEPSSTEVW